MNAYIKYFQKQNGQALIESLFSYLLILLVSFSVIEVCRLQAFKAILQSSVQYYAKYFAFEEMKLIRQKKLSLTSKIISSPKNIENQIKIFISKDLEILGTSLFSFDESTKYTTHHLVLVSADLLANQIGHAPAGVYIKAQTCLPVLFSSFFQNFLPKLKTEIGRNVNEITQKRNCLGEYLKNTRNKKQSSKIPLFWFRVRAAAYAPWPASTQIFYNGLAIPDMDMIDKDARMTFNKRFEEVNFEQFQNNQTKIH